MTNQENELRAQLKNTDEEVAVKAAVDLCREILHPQNRWEESEMVLLGAVGLQTSASGQIIHLLLGQTYVKMNELSRAVRFFDRACESSVPEIKTQAESALNELRQK